MTDTPTFGELLRRYRLLAGLTQEALAERAHLSIRAVSALEQGINRAPRAATLALLAEALALSSEARDACVAVAQQETRMTRKAVAASPAGRATEPRVVGREQELALLGAHLAGKGPPLLLLAGEPGIGKSCLLTEAVRRGGASGWQVLYGGCTRSGGQLPYTPLLQALQRQLANHPAARRRTMLRGCAWLVRLLPELADGPIEPLPPWTVTPEQERRLLFDAVGRFVTNVATATGTLLVLDDLQWAGADALDLMASLVVGSGATARIVGTYRYTEVHPADPLAVVQADLAQAGLLRHHLLPPLAAAEVRQLLDVHLDGEAGDRDVLAARVAQRTGGVPFFVVSCAQALRDGAEAGLEAIPWDVAQAIRQRVAALPTAAQEALGAAAITAGRMVNVLVLAAVLGQSEHAVVAALETAWRARLLDDAASGYRIAHDLIREVLEADLGPARRAMLHRQTAEMIEGQPGVTPAEVLAYHYGRSDVPDRAVRYLEQAGDQAQAKHGWAAAEGFYHEAVERLDGLGRHLDAARVREKLGRLLHTGARYAEALAALEPAAEVLRAAGDLEATGRIEAQIAYVHTDLGTAAEGLARIEPVLALLGERGPSKALASLYTAQADLLYMRGRLREELAATEHGERIARLVGADHQLAYALYMRGGALVCLGRLAEAINALSTAISVAEASNDFWDLGWALTWLAMTHTELGSFAASRQIMERVLLLAERHGFRMMVAYATVWCGWSAFYTGEWIAARRDFERAAAISREVGPFFGSFYPPLGLGMLCLAEGAQAEASLHLEECERLLGSGGDAYMRRQVAWVLAERHLLEGYPQEARVHLAPLLVQGALEEDTAPSLHLMAWALLDLGEVDEAAEVAWQAVARARDQGRQPLLVDALRVAAMVAARQGRWEEAEEMLQEGPALARRLGYPYGEARLLQVYGGLHVQLGQSEPARERLEAARAIYQRLGARKDLERVEQELARIG
jgi:tetratricopeptide (TPR) repeat protein/transcriptional regulator with XRE-family HTH domain